MNSNDDEETYNNASSDINTFNNNEIQKISSEKCRSNKKLKQGEHIDDDEKENNRCGEEDSLDDTTSPKCDTKCSSSGSRNENNLVAESDFQSAMTALESVWNDRIFHSAHEKEQSTTFTTDEMRFSRQVFNSLRRNIHQVAQPITDEEYHNLIIIPQKQQQQQEQPKEEDPEDDRDENKKGEEKEKDDDEADSTSTEEYEFDPEELLDIQALERARELRKQVRESAKQVQLYRNSILERSIRLAQRHVNLLRRHGQEEKPEENDDSFNNLDERQQENDDDDDVDETKQNVMPMTQSLQKMTEMLHCLQTQLPDCVENLQHTVSNVGKTMDSKNSSVENLSQTERAILSQNYDDYDDDEKQIIDIKMDLMVQEDPFSQSPSPLLSSSSESAAVERVPFAEIVNHNPHLCLSQFLGRHDVD